MEINITRFFSEACPRDYSASVAEIGNDAGPSTWRAACDDSEDWPILADDDAREEFRQFVRSSGGWSDEEIARWSDAELNALAIQWAAGDIREAGLSPASSAKDWARYQADAESGRVNSNLFRTDDSVVYWSIAR